jgi:hypothetical protein
VQDDLNACSWMAETHGTNFLAYAGAQYSVQNAVADIKTAAQISHELAIYLHENNAFISHEFGDVFHFSELYLLERLTKLELCAAFLNSSKDFSMRKMSGVQQNVKDFETAMEMTVGAIDTDVLAAFDGLFSLEPTVLSSESLRRFQILQRANNSGWALAQEAWDNLATAQDTHLIVRTITQVSERGTKVNSFLWYFFLHSSTSLNHSFTHSLNHSLIHSLSQSLTHSLTHSFTHPPNHLSTHPLTRPFQC